MEITNNRIPATPRSKYYKYDNYGVGKAVNKGEEITNYVKLTGEEYQTIEGNLGATGDLIAYSSNDVKAVFPIASTTSLGTIKVGNNLTITEDGTLNAQAGGASNWNEIQNKPTTLAGYGITDAAKQSDLTNHTGNDDIHVTSDEKKGWNTAYNVAHSHSNKENLDTINQNLATTSSPTFNYGTFTNGFLTGNSTGLNIVHSNENSISGRSGTKVANLYLNYTDGTTNVLIDSNCNIKTSGDVIAYKAGTSSAPFKYWRPSVSPAGVLSWTNSEAVSTPASVNIKGPKGDQGAAGERGATGERGPQGEKGATGPQGPAGNLSNGGLINGATWVKNPSSGSITYITGNSITGYSSSLPNLWIHYYPNAKASGTTAPSANYRVLYVGGKQENVAILKVNDGNSGSFSGNYAGNSDIRLKENITPITGILDSLNDISAFTFTYIGEKDIHYGVSAQEVQKHFPNLVSYRDDDYLVLKYIEMNTVFAVGGLKELYAIVKEQQKRIKELEDKLNK